MRAEIETIMRDESKPFWPIINGSPLCTEGYKSTKGTNWFSATLIQQYIEKCIIDTDNGEYYMTPSSIVSSTLHNRVRSKFVTSEWQKVNEKLKNDFVILMPGGYLGHWSLIILTKKHSYLLESMNNYQNIFEKVKSSVNRSLSEANENWTLLTPRDFQKDKHSCGPIICSKAKQILESNFYEDNSIAHELRTLSESESMEFREELRAFLFKKILMDINSTADTVEPLSDKIIKDMLQCKQDFPEYHDFQALDYVLEKNNILYRFQASIFAM